MPSSDAIELARQVLCTLQAQQDYFAVSKQRGSSSAEAGELLGQCKRMERRLKLRAAELLAVPRPTLFGEAPAEARGLPD